MSPRFVVTGTDTGVGKTVFAAALAARSTASTGSRSSAASTAAATARPCAVVRTCRPDRILPEVYRLEMPASPHIAAEHEGIEIDPGQPRAARVDRPLVIEGAGGLMVPITDELLQIDLFARWQIPVILVARTALGTINHSLLVDRGAEPARRADLRHRLRRRGERCRAAHHRQHGPRASSRPAARTSRRSSRSELAEAFRANFSRRVFPAMRPARDEPLARLASLHAARAPTRRDDDREGRGRVARDGRRAPASSMPSRRGGW